MADNQEKYEGDVKIKLQGSFWKKLENFWYHYKWHTIAVLFTVFVISICSLQCATGQKYDIHILYAGNHAFKRTSDDGSYSEYMTAVKSIKDFAKDYDENGEVSISFLDLYMLTAEEIEALQNDNKGGEIPFQLLQENSSLLKNNLNMSDYYVCFLSERLFKKYSEGESNEGRFAKISHYTKEGLSYDYVSDYGIRLSSLDFKNLPGISSLDADDTVVCIRNVSSMSSLFAKESSLLQFKRGEDLLRSILAFQE